MSENHILWRNPSIRKCPYCWFTEPCTTCYWKKQDGKAHLRRHLLEEHHQRLIVYVADLGLKDIGQAAWQLVENAKMPPSMPEVVRVG